MSVSLADHLRALPDPELAALIALRPDLVVPVPADISALAVRAQSRLSVARALDGLDQFTLEVLDAVRLSAAMEPAGPDVTSVLALATASGADAERVRTALDRLRALSLVYGPDSALHVAASVFEVCPPYPAGLGRPAADLDPAAAALVEDPAGLRRAVLAAPPPARAVLDRLAQGPPIGTIPATRTASDPESPVRWLVERHLLVPISSDTVELPREVALLLRRDTGPLGPLHSDPPTLDMPRHELAAIDRAGAGQAIEVVRRTDALLEALSREPAPVLRSGGLGVRELKRLAKAVAIDEPATGLLLEVAYAAGLLGGSDADNGEPVFLPTTAYDMWRTASLAQRWHRLALAWLLMTRVPSLIGQRDERDRPVPALAPEAERVTAPGVRRAALAVLADAEPGTAPAPADVRAILAWRSPRRAARSSASAPGGPETALSEASAFGFTGLNALTGYARLLLSEVDSAALAEADGDPLGVHADPGAPARAVDALDALLPAPVDHVLLQADLTMVVPGPPEPTLVAELALAAEQESPSVFRVTAESVRRALDAGYAPAELHAMFARRSRTPVPQALSYLVDDVARRHGGLRVGSAAAYLRSTDEALLAEVLADRRLVGLGLRRLAPTVLLTPYPTGRLLGALRDAGYAPVAEDANGAAVLSRPRARRAPPRPAVSNRRSDDPMAYARISAPRLAGIVEQMRRGEAAARAARRAPVTLRTANGAAGAAGAQAHIQAMAVLQQALRDRTRVWVGYVDSHGASASRLVRPISIGSGYLRAEDERTEMLHTLALHRITAAQPEE